MNSTLQNATEIFRRFCHEKSIGEKSTISRHLKSIFQAGWSESRLEVSELLNHTTHELFKGNNLLRSVLAVFIVIGLLGTLVGLADSLAQLSPVLGMNNPQQTNEGINRALRALLTQMKSAFAPSILGVLFTVLGVIFYSLYIRFACSPVKSTLERLTLTVWVPQLYPTTSQKIIETLQSEQLRKVVETASQVNEIATSVQSEISDFNQNLGQANPVIGLLTSSVSQINRAAEVINEAFAQRLSKFSDEFSGNVSRLTSFQDDIRTLYQQMIDESETFQSVTRETIDAQNKRLTNILKAIKSYEDAYIAERGQIDAKLQQFLDEAIEATTSVNAKNRELVEQIRDQLTTKLGEIENTLRVQLSGITQEFNRFDVPIARAAEKIEGSQENFAKFMERTVGDLQREFQKQNDNNKQQLDSITQLNQRIETLLIQLDQSSKTQGDEVHTLGQNVGSLTGDITSLTTNITSLTSNAGSLSQSVRVIEGHVETLGTAAQKLAATSHNIPSLASNIGTLDQSVRTLVQHVQTLGRLAPKPAEPIKPPRVRETPKREKFLFFFWRTPR
ncbi:MotA/TolQ/ExbB proton channel family protein [Candidatus Poribacteria bacterium]|nr:MotA/TolQ/ExbB proton channel family protein [Candidatus Poribacteria bacterium]